MGLPSERKSGYVSVHSEHAIQGPYPEEGAPGESTAGIPNTCDESEGVAPGTDSEVKQSTDPESGTPCKRLPSTSPPPSSQSVSLPPSVHYPALTPEDKHAMPPYAPSPPTCSSKDALSFTPPTHILEQVARIQDGFVDALGWAFRVHVNCEIAVHHLLMYGRLPTLEEALAIRGFGAHSLPPSLGDQSHASVHADHLSLLATVWRGVVERTAILEEESNRSHHMQEENSRTVAVKASKKRKRN